MQGFFSAVFYLAGALGLAFVLWRKLKEDYKEDLIFYLTIILVGILLLASKIFGTYLPDFSFLGIVVSLIFVTLYSFKKLGFKFFESIDALSMGGLWFLFFLGADWLLKTRASSPAAVLNILVISLSLLSYKFFLSRYRRFSWYPSGKVGFPGLASLAIFFLLNSAVAFYSRPVLSFPWIVNIGTSVILSLTLSTILYLRSGRAGAERIILKWQKK